MDAIPDSYRNELELEDLVDIRENSAYIAFVSMIGGYINFEENGYEILAREYKRELKYAAGNLMRLQMREVIDKSIETIHNFYKGFLTYDKLKKAVDNKTLRQIRIFVTKDKKNSAEAMLEEAARKKKDEEQKAKQQQPKRKTLDVIKKRRETTRSRLNLGESETSVNNTPWDEEP